LILMADNDENISVIAEKNLLNRVHSVPRTS